MKVDFLWLLCRLPITYGFFVIAVVLLVTVAHTSITPGPPHLLDHRKIFVLKQSARYCVNLGSWFVASGEGWSHERIPPPARGLVLKSVNMLRDNPQ